MRARGFTLVELLVATALMAIVVMYLMQTFTVQHRTYTVVEQVSEAQQNERAIAGLLEREIRAAGFLVPEGAAVCGVDNTTAPDVLYVSAANVLSPTGVDDPDVGLALHATSGTPFVTGGGGVFRLADSVVNDGDNGFFDTDGDGNDDSDFVQGMGVIVTDTADPSRGSGCGRITAAPVPNPPVPGNALTLTVTWDEQLPVGATSSYLVVPAHVYQVNGSLQLLRDGQVLATDIEDLQVSYFFDSVTADGVPDTGFVEEPGDGGAGAPVYDPSSWRNSDLREVRLNFVVRSRGQDPNTDFSEGRFQVLENRADPNIVDRFRRRVHRAVVRTRNLGFRDQT